MIHSRAGAALLAAGVAASAVSPAVAASRPNPPTVSALRNVTIPWADCVDAYEWINWRKAPGTKVSNIWVDAVFRNGNSRPLSTGDQVCGFMGPASYSLRIGVVWKIGKRVKVKRAVWRWHTVRRVIGHTEPTDVYTPHPFTCDLVSPVSNDPGSGGGYSCRFDDGSPWTSPNGYSHAGVTFNGEVRDPYVWWAEDGEVWQNGANAQFNPPNLGGLRLSNPVTGTLYVYAGMTKSEPIYGPVRERYVHHYRQVRVTKWVKGGRFKVVRQVQVSSSKTARWWCIAW